ncbi:MAG TPA: hypothetical protein PLL00_13045 [Bacteroidia bacterium]|nr:hypothetical protein [Bacteroidia bacterium]
MEKFIDRGSVSGQNKGRGELNVYLVYAILVVTAIIFMILIREIK